MHHRHFYIKSIAKTFFGLRGQANLRNHYQCLTTVADNFFDALKIDFGFATAGDAIYQPGIKTVAVDGIHGLLL